MFQIHRGPSRQRATRGTRGDERAIFAKLARHCMMSGLSGTKQAGQVESLNIAVLTVSDTRTLETDTSGQFLCDAVSEAGHRVVDRAIVIDDVYRLRAATSHLIADEGVEVVLVTGGTGFSKRDSTPDALAPLFDRSIEGFGELFRQLSYEEIGTSTIQSRAVAGIANNTLVFCVPGSTGACRTAWNRILRDQLDSEFKPCNFAELLRKGQGHQ